MIDASCLLVRQRENEKADKITDFHNLLRALLLVLPHVLRQLRRGLAERVPARERGHAVQRLDTERRFFPCKTKSNQYRHKVEE